LFYFPIQNVFGGLNLVFKIKEESKITGYKKGSSIVLGAFYRAKDAIAITSIINYSSYSFGISYDVNVSSLSKASMGRGAMEVYFRFVTPDPFGTISSSKARFY